MHQSLIATALHNTTRLNIYGTDGRCSSIILTRCTDYYSPSFTSLQAFRHTACHVGEISKHFTERVVCKTKQKITY